jgi:hypothetical protein
MANAGQSLQVSSLFSAVDAEGDPLTYFFEDGTAAASSGHFVLNGTALANGAAFHVSAAQLAQLTFVAGSVDDNLSMQVGDDKGALSAGVGIEVHVTSGASGSAGALVVNNAGFTAFSTAANDPEQFRFADSASPAQPSGILGDGLHSASAGAEFAVHPAAATAAGAAIANAVIPDLFGDTAALHDLHPSAHLADYFIV